jgi:putative phage-type endonuclease
MKIPTEKLTYEEWKALRRKGIGGSDAAAALGLSRWKSPLRLYLEKIGEVESDADTEAAYWGNILEDIVAKEFERRTGKKVQRVNAILIHPKYEWMLANIDRKVVGENALLECKTTSEWNKAEWKDDEIPQEYIFQLQHYLAVTGYEKAYIAVLIGGNKFIWKEVARDNELIEMIIEGEKKFWEKVVSRTPPDLDGSKDAAEILKYLYPKAEEGTSIELPAYESLVDEIVSLNKQIKQLEELKAEKENKLKEAMGEHETAIVGKYKVTWKNITSNRFDSRTFKKEYPDLYAKFVETSTYRRFSIKEEE